MTKTIEQLTARVRELEEENARLKREDFSHERIHNDTLKLQNRVLYEKMIEAQAYAEQLREVLILAQVGSCSCCTKSHESKYHLKSCTFRILDEALDAYVAEKVKEIIESHAPEGRNVTNAQHVEMRLTDAATPQ